MKAIWVDAGSDADYAKLRRYQITDVYFDVREPRVTLDYLESVRKNGFNPGVFICSQGAGWPSPVTHSGPAFADWAYQQVQRVAPGTKGDFPKVCLNCETHDPDWLLAAFKRWRSHSPARWTSWSMEGHQTGWMTTQFVLDLLKLNFDAYHPQAYRGDMTRMESDRVALEMVKAGFPVGRIWTFYNAAELGYWWEGVIFTQGTLP